MKNINQYLYFDNERQFREFFPYSFKLDLDEGKIAISMFNKEFGKDAEVIGAMRAYHNSCSWTWRYPGASNLILNKMEFLFRYEPDFIRARLMI